jgi:hypothetical protein
MVGCLLIYIAFLYEDEEGRVQGKLEELWVRLKDSQDASLSRTTSFLSIVATLTGKSFDRLFGRRLLSLRFLVISVYLSLASLLLFTIVASRFTHNAQLGSLPGNAWHAVIFGSIALAPALVDSKFFRIFWWVCALAIPLLQITAFLIFVIAKRGLTPSIHGIGYFATPFIASLGCDLAYIALTRWSLRRVAKSQRLYNIVLMGLGNIAILALLVLGPILIGLEIGKYYALLGGLIMVSFPFNSIDFLIASVALFVALVLLLDRFVWFAILRPLYSVQRFHIVRNKKALLTAGLALILVPTHWAWELLTKLVSLQ